MFYWINKYVKYTQLCTGGCEKKCVLRESVFSYFPVINSSVCRSVFLSPLGALPARKLVRRGWHEWWRAGGDQTVFLLLSSIQQGRLCSITLIFSVLISFSDSRHSQHISYKYDKKARRCKARLENISHFLLLHFSSLFSPSFSLSLSLTLSFFFFPWTLTRHFYLFFHNSASLQPVLSL